MPTLYMMVGLPGSGKSSWAEKNFVYPGSPVAIHASDAIRREIYGDENQQGDPRLVFQLLHNRVFADLKAGKDVVFDATNIDYKRRIDFLNKVNALHIPNLYKLCVFMATPYRQCCTDNAMRSRNVPQAVIDRMLNHFDVPMKCEGWDSIWIERNSGVNYMDIFDLMAGLCQMPHDNPNHSYSIGSHCIEAWRYLLQNYPKAGRAMSRAALLHDIGKEKTKVFHDAKGNPTDIAHYYHHDRAGAYLSFSFTGDLPVEERLETALLIRWHMLPFVIEKSSNPSKTEQKFRNLLGEDTCKQLTLLNDCDRHAH